MKQTIFCIAIFSILMVNEGCSPAGGEKTGHEFMPDMVHSTAYEANISEYYYYNTWGSEEEYKKFIEPRLPVEGTIARGHSTMHYAADVMDRMKAEAGFDGSLSHTAVPFQANGAVPYYYDDTEEERTRAMAEIIDNPYPITTEGLARGKELYTIYCGICHGDKADGGGYLVRDEDPAKGILAGVYPAQPANLLQQEFYDATNGRYYHNIMYGKNMMGAYKDKLSYEERWQVIHYIRSLQAKEQGLVYSESANTFTNDMPGAAILAQIEAERAHKEETGEGGESHGDEDHGEEDHGNEHGHDDDHNGGH